MMDKTPYEKLNFSQIKHRLPADSRAAQYEELHQGEWDDKKVLYYKGNLNVDVLNLDDPRQEVGFSKQPSANEQPVSHLADRTESICMVLIEGNLTVSQLIANMDTEQALHLIVLGDLYTPNMLVGGQEVYIAGSLRVQELLWGDYHHGQLTVKGNLTAALLLQTEKYQVAVVGKTNCQAHWTELKSLEPWNGMERIEAFDPRYVMQPDEDHFFFCREQMIGQLLQEQSVLRLDKLRVQAPASIPFLFENDEINPVNIRRVTESHLLCMRHPGDTAPCYEFWGEELFLRAVAYGEETVEGCFQSIYMQNNNRQAVLVRSEPVEQQRDILPGILSGSSAYLWQVSFKFRYLDGHDTEWHTLNHSAPAAFHQLCQQGWKKLLQAVSNYEYACTLVAPEQVHELLALPLAQPYDDFYDEQRHGLWLEDLFIAFRQQNALYKGEPQPPLLRIGREYQDASGTTKHENYFYTVSTHADQTETVCIGYKADEESGQRIPISFTGDPQLHYAASMFNKASRLMKQYNKALLKGELPRYAGETAQTYWEENGYARRYTSAEKVEEASHLESPQSEVSHSDELSH